MGIVSYIYSKNFEKYNIGFIERRLEDLGSLDFSDATIHWVDLRGYASGWVADPFIVDYDDRAIRVLVEEFVYAQHKGRISALTIDRKTYQLIDRKPILENDTHFSFPAPIRENGKLYIYPENYQSGKLMLYELDNTTLEVVNEHVLIHEALSDTQIVKIGEWYYAFGIVANNRGNLFDDTRRVTIYRAPSLFGPYEQFQTIDNERRIERGAGNIFWLGDMLIRPVQVCEKSYGEATLFMLLDFDGHKFCERIVGGIAPRRLTHWGFGLHTFNSVGDLIVVDGIDYNWHYFSLWFKPLVRLFRR